MDQAIFDRKLSRILDSLGKHRPTLRAPTGYPLMGLCETFFFILWLTIAPVCAFFTFWSLDGGLDNWLNASFFTCIIGGTGTLLLFGLSSLIDKKSTYSRSLHHAMVRIVFRSWLRKSLPLCIGRAETINKLCTEYPRIMDMCVRWAAQNEAHTLTTREWEAIDLAMEKIYQLVESFNLSVNERTTASNVHDILNKTQLIDKALALHNKNQLQQHTGAVNVPDTRRSI